MLIVLCYWQNQHRCQTHKRGTQRNLVCVFGPMPPYFSVCCHFPVTLSDYGGKRKNNVIKKIKVVISNCCSGKGSRLWVTILGYVAAWGWKQSVRSQPVWRRMKKETNKLCVLGLLGLCLEMQSCLAAICFLCFASWQVKLRFYKTLYATIYIYIYTYM